jgi:hypothetical protein
MPRKKVSDQYDQVSRDDEEHTDDKEEIKPQKSPKVDKRWHDANRRQVERVPFDAPIESNQVICGLNECILGVRHELSAAMSDKTELLNVMLARVNKADFTRRSGSWKADLGRHQVLPEAATVHGRHREACASSHYRSAVM